MDKCITSFVGLDVHKDSTAIAAAETGREAPRFLGTVGPDWGQRNCSITRGDYAGAALIWMRVCKKGMRSA
jgi:hypothetical protein